MPYPNEHSARLRSPDDFNPDTFRRVDGGTIFGRVEVPKTIAVIWGKLKGADSADDFPVAQALRFPVKDWTEAKAKKWLKDNDVTVIKFEKATKAQTGGEPMDEGKMATFPAEAFMLNETETDMHVLLRDEEDRPRRVKMVVNSGKPHGHHIWGNMVLDMNRGTIGKQKKSILVEHNPLLIAGQTDKVVIGDDGKITAEGFITDKTEVGRERMGLLAEDHPFEVSLLAIPKRVVRLSEGQTREVNGRQVSGPCHVFQDWKMREVSLCALGADERTSATALSDTGKGEVTVHLFGDDDQTVEPRKVDDVKLSEEAQVQEEVKDEVKDEDKDEATQDVSEEGTDEPDEKEGTGEDGGATSEDGDSDDETGDADEESAELKMHDAGSAERNRCLAIMKKANTLGLGGLGEQLVQEGHTIEAAIIKLQDARLEQLTSGAPDAPGVNSGEDGEAIDQSLPLEERVKAEWALADDMKKKAFFGKYEYFLEYMKYKEEA